MWITTTGGFISVVQHNEDPGLLMVRARDRTSLVNLLEGLDESHEILSQPADESWDYPHRVVVSRDELLAFLSREVYEFLTYSNFKSAAEDARGTDFSDPLHTVWTVMRDLTEPEFTSDGDERDTDWDTTDEADEFVDLTSEILDDDEKFAAWLRGRENGLI